MKLRVEEQFRTERGKNEKPSYQEGNPYPSSVALRLGFSCRLQLSLV